MSQVCLIRVGTELFQVDIAAARRPASGRSLCQKPQVGGA